MSKTVVIHQPDFLPHLGFFHRLIHADLFVILDVAQFVTGTTRSWTNRDKIKTPRGEQWITVGVKAAPRDTAIRDIELAESDWRRRNINLIRENYKEAQFLDQIYPRLEGLYSGQETMLMDFNLRSIEILKAALDIEIPTVLASDLNPVGKKNDMLVDILRKVEATHYLSGIGARGYMTPEVFEQTGIKVVWQEFAHPVYKQLHNGFIPYLSSIDLLLNCGVDESRRIVRSC